MCQELLPVVDHLRTVTVEKVSALKVSNGSISVIVRYNKLLVQMIPEPKTGCTFLNLCGYQNCTTRVHVVLHVRYVHIPLLFPFCTNSSYIYSTVHVCTTYITVGLFYIKCKKYMLRIEK